jgi:hypothetical protein
VADGEVTHMGEQESKDAFRAFVERAVSIAASAGDGRHTGRMPLYNMEYDAQFANLAEFAPAVRCLEVQPSFERLYGRAEAPRFALCLLYGYLDSAPGPQFDDAAFEGAWAAYWSELHEPSWRYMTVCNLSDFAHSVAGVGRTDALDLGDGVSVRPRSSTWATSIDRNLWDGLARDWEDGAQGQFVLVCEERVPKSPENVVLNCPLSVQQKQVRAIIALRLAGAGDLRHGRVFRVRPSNIRLSGGWSYSGWSRWNPGTHYNLDPSTFARYRDVYCLLASVEPALSTGWMPLATALRRYNGLYERELTQREDRILDAITAIEALLGDKLETTFKVTSRVATLLGADDDSRVALFDSMKLYYDTRSCLVHGSDLKQKHIDVIQDHTNLLDIARRLIVGFVRLASSGEFTKVATLKESIDGILLHTGKREELRAKMGL